MFQNEYRQVNKNSKHIADFSLKNKDSTSKTHFFSNSIAKLSMDKFDISEIEMNLVKNHASSARFVKEVYNYIILNKDTR